MSLYQISLYTFVTVQFAFICAAQIQGPPIKSPKDVKRAQLNEDIETLKRECDFDKHSGNTLLKILGYAMSSLCEHNFAKESKMFLDEG